MDTYHIRKFSTDKKKRFIAKPLNDSDLRVPTGEDLHNIYTKINKRFSLEAFDLTNTYICNDGLAIKLPEQYNQSWVVTNEFKTAVIVEGFTDFLSSITLGLHGAFDIISRKSKTGRYILGTDYTDVIYLLDKDDSIDNAIDKISNKAVINPNTQIKHIKIDEIFNSSNISDISDISSNVENESLLDSLLDRMTNEPANDFNTYCDVSDLHLINFFDSDCKIDNYKLFKALEEEGVQFITIDKNPAHRKLARFDNNIIEYLTNQSLHSYALNELVNKVPEDKLPVGLLTDNLREAVWEKSNLFTESRYNLFKTTNIETKSDTAEHKYIYLKDCFIDVSKDYVNYCSYETLDKPIFKQDVWNDIEFTYLPYIDFEDGAECRDCEFDIFLQHTCTNRDSKEFDKQRYLALKSVIGYLLHNYKNPALLKAVIFTEANLTDEPQGRTGKGLILQAISKLSHIANIDGKKIDGNSGRFEFSNVTEMTNLIAFNDVKSSFNFENYFSMLTDAFVMEKKGENKIEIPANRSAKMYISTNKRLKNIEGGSYEDRMYTMELYCYYSNTYKPTHEFGHLFFDDWEIEEWNKFYSLLIHCIQIYLRNSLIEYESSTALPSEIIRYITKAGYDKLVEAFSEMRNSIEIGYSKERLLNEIKEVSERDRLTQTTITKCLKKMALYHLYDLQPRASIDKQPAYKLKQINNNNLFETN